MVQFLDEAAVRKRLQMPALIECMQQALIDFSAGGVIQPLRQFINIDSYNGVFGLMPAVSNAMGIKLVTFYPDNQAKGLHTHHALILVFDPETGEPLAVMDGRLITEMRTAAVSAVATRLLAAPQTPVLAILGSGVQARAHVEALCCVRDIEEIRVWSRSTANAATFAAQVGATVMGAEEAVRDADIVVTATAATQPILQGAWLKNGAHVNAVGWNGPDGRELDDEAMRCLVFVESRDAALDQAGNVRGSHATIMAEIGAALVSPDRTWQEQTTIFDSIGMAIEDVSAAQLILDLPGGKP
jgi:thiomorpholine-carboxylate dehydrogenase